MTHWAFVVWVEIRAPYNYWLMTIKKVYRVYQKGGLFLSRPRQDKDFRLHDTEISCARLDKKCLYIYAEETEKMQVLHVLRNKCLSTFAETIKTTNSINIMCLSII